MKTSSVPFIYKRKKMSRLEINEYIPLEFCLFPYSIYELDELLTSSTYIRIKSMHKAEFSWKLHVPDNK